MTDNEIIKALECCYGDNLMDCDSCPNKKTCADISVVNSVLDLINSQKTEIERLKLLKPTLHYWYEKCNDLVDELKTAKSEAIREFAERLKGKKYWDIDIDDYVFVNDIDNVVKEMTKIN